ncbi:egg cell-secreted protein 1.2-like [Durio zibethinus]|uniref:Egg cell-secreted protein 1.2-like n=1 Tax=Durio zibethinus TaxID=66656 RepID=A0A6P5ZHG1_DURZI|nr:egg cell-secreted protein 1.2-like [Durio zibethinus]
MSKTAQAIAFLFLAATACTVVLVQPGVAQVLSTPHGTKPQIPGLFPPGTPNDVIQCWSSIMSIQGCAWEIYRSIFSGQFGNISPACCQAILSIQENCWPKMFPTNPPFVPKLKDSCSHNGGGAPPTWVSKKMINLVNVQIFGLCSLLLSK